MIVLKEMLSLTIFLFFTGMIGVALNRKNIIITMMSIELMLLAVNLNFLIFSQQFDDVVGQIFVLFILTIAASESAIGLAILSLYNSTKNTITFDVLKNQNFNLNIRKRRELIPHSRRFFSTLADRDRTTRNLIKNSADPLVNRIEKLERIVRILLALGIFLMITTFFVIWLMDQKNLVLQNQNNHILLRNQELKQQVIVLTELISKMKHHPGPYLNYFCVFASTVVVLGACIYLGPAPFVVIKNGIYVYLSCCFQYTDIAKYTTVSSKGVSLDWWIRVFRGTRIDILVKPPGQDESLYALEYIEILHRALEAAKSALL